MRPVSLRQIEAFKAVVEHGTVSAAAEALSISQPSLSKLIANLERDIELVLFEREKGRLVLTDRGRRLYSEIDRIFVGLDQLHRAVSEIRREELDVLRIGVLPALSGRVLQEAVRRYLSARPKTRLSLRIRESYFLSDWIENGKLDLLIASHATEIKGLERLSLMRAPVVCALPRGHSLAGHRVITPALLAGENLICLTDDSRLPGRVRDVFDAAGISVSSTIEVSLMSSLCQLVEAGLGVSLMHPLVAASWADNVHIRPFEPSIMVEFSIYRTQARRHRPLVEEFVNCFLGASSESLDRTLSSPSPVSGGYRSAG
ncbi:MAG: LysR substrate-binding domain-containing protein [Pseudochelatococcus sp.]|jgi:DNA-binding transcriptional LysR family regulator|uniref:LysR substrate-binding domain-containing protein n=1 Tax=Pseudochelatococcus sp. TaxID=2020869 RepID=UPI003D92767A